MYCNFTVALLQSIAASSIVNLIRLINLIKVSLMFYFLILLLSKHSCPSIMIFMVIFKLIIKAIFGNYLSQNQEQNFIIQIIARILFRNINILWTRCLWLTQIIIYPFILDTHITLMMCIFISDNMFSYQWQSVIESINEYIIPPIINNVCHKYY